MVEILGGRLGSVRKFAPLPSLATPEDILGDALPVLDPPNRMTVTDAAERYLRVQTQGVWQSFDRQVTPYMVEPSNMTQSRLFKAVGFTGPAQSGKTMMLQAVALHPVTCDQKPILIVHMSRPERDKWVEEKLNPLIYNSPEIKDRLGTGREDSTFSRKRFRGMRLLIGYPTPLMLSGGTYGMVLLTDIDHHPLVLGGKDNPEGSPFKMSMQRIKTYMSNGCVLAEGSPAYPVLDPAWQPRPEAPHEMPPVIGGIMQIYNQGTRGRWYWECMDCGEEYEPRFDRLKYDESLEPGAAGDTAEMQCPHCGSLIAHRHKFELNRAALKDKGGWRHEGQDGALVGVTDPDIRRTDIASYALNGAAATFANWRDLVASYEEARRKAELLGDETDLATVNYTEIGLSHRPLKRGDGEEIGVQFLRDHAQPAEKGVAPEWTRFLTVSVDVQGTYFPVQVTAWGEDGRAQVVDRFDLTQPPAGAPNAAPDAEGNSRTLDPARYIEDWSVLEGLAERVWPVAGAGYGLKAFAAAVDFQGRPGVSDNAELFWKQRRRKNQGTFWYLTRGHGGWKVPSRFWYDSPERKSGGGKGRSIKLLNIATDRLKDTIYSALGKAEGGTGALYTPGWMTEQQLAEFVAEERLSNGWKMKKGQVRNEGTDLSVQARSLAEYKGLMRMNWAAPLPWALEGPDNSYAVKLEQDAAAPATATAPASKPAARRKVHKMNYLRRN